MLADVKLRKTQFLNCKALTLDNIRDNLGKKHYQFLLFFGPRMFCLYQQTKATSSVLHVFERKTSGQGVVKAGKGFTLFISNEDMYITEFVESLEELCLLIDDELKL